MGRDAVVVQRDAAGRDAIGVGRGDGGGKGCVGAVGLGCAAREGIGMDVEGCRGTGVRWAWVGMQWSRSSGLHAIREGGGDGGRKEGCDGGKTGAMDANDAPLPTTHAHKEKIAICHPKPSDSGASLSLFNTDVSDNLVTSGSGAHGDTVYDAFTQNFPTPTASSRTVTCNEPTGEDHNHVMNAAIVVIPSQSGRSATFMMGNGTLIRNNRRTGDQAMGNMFLSGATVVYQLPYGFGIQPAP